MRFRRRKSAPVTLRRAKEVADQLGLTLDEFYGQYYAPFPSLRDHHAVWGNPRPAPEVVDQSARDAVLHLCDALEALLPPRHANPLIDEPDHESVLLAREKLAES